MTGGWKKEYFLISVEYFVLEGVLLFGPPGCGKTMIAKATAKASGCKFINLQASTLTDMWYGESQKLTAAVFSLAVKIHPCIIFIDEIGECILTGHLSRVITWKMLLYYTVRWFLSSSLRFQAEIILKIGYLYSFDVLTVFMPKFQRVSFRISFLLSWKSIKSSI